MERVRPLIFSKVIAIDILYHLHHDSSGFLGLFFIAGKIESRKWLAFLTNVAKLAAHTQANCKIAHIANQLLLAATFGCDSLFNNGVNSPDDENLDPADELAKTATLDYEAASAEAAGCSTLTNKDAIPFLPGTTYRFDASGAGDFAVLSLEVTTPATRLEITSPLEGTSIDGTADLEVSWQGGDNSQKLMIALVPILDRSNFQGPGARFHAEGQNGNGPFGGRHHGPGGQFGRNGMQPGKFHDLHLRFVIEENNGSFTIPADAITQVLAIEGVKGVALQVMQMLATEVEQNDAQYALVLRQGDLVKLDVASQ